MVAAYGFQDIRKEVAAFLAEFRKIATGKGLIRVDESTKNWDTLMQLGITERQRMEEILTISLTDFSDISPERITGEGRCYIFGKSVCTSEVYIKLKIEDRNGISFARCVSFHEPEREMEFPLRR
jgi:hypothetical protein